MKLLFVCHGNICRSPMAEFIMKKLVADEGIEGIEIASAAVSTEEIGNDIYYPAMRTLKAHNIPFTRHAARQVVKGDFEYYDYVLVMDNMNLSYLTRRFGQDILPKTRLLLSFTGSNEEISDPWYHDNFEQSYREILAGCKGLLETIKVGRQ